MRTDTMRRGVERRMMEEEREKSEGRKGKICRRRKTWSSEREEGNGRGVGCEGRGMENMRRGVGRRRMERERKKRGGR